MLRNYAGAIVLILTSCFPIGVSEAEHQETFYSQLTRGVVRLERQDDKCDADSQKVLEKRKLIGSAFFVRDFFEGRSRHFIVTARHNIDHPVDHFIRVPIGPGAKESVVLSLPHSDWVFHPAPTHPGHLPIDVAVMEMVAVPFIKAFLNCPAGGTDGECGNHPKTKKPLLNQLGKTPTVLNRVIFLGFPGGLTPANSLEPMARSGVVASTFDNRDLREERGRRFSADSIYLVDAVALGGHSGGPVVKEQTPLSGGIQLWGLVTGSNVREARFTIVTRPEMIAETIAHARQFSKVNGRWSHDVSPLALECPTNQL